MSEVRTRIGAISLVAVITVLAVQAGARGPLAQTNSTVWSGVYAAAQADRGKAVYARHCSRCHGDDPMNGRNPLAGDRFTERWESRMVADLFQRIRDTMPPGEASTVGAADKVDALAYLLQQNGFPAGDAELPSDVDPLSTIQITGKSGPIPVRTGTLVRAAGCLELRDRGVWELTNATEPKRALFDQAAPQQPSPRYGVRTIVLLNPFPNPTAHRGHHVAATGFLVRRDDGDAVNVVSLEMLESACTPDF